MTHTHGLVSLCWLCVGRCAFVGRAVTPPLPSLQLIYEVDSILTVCPWRRTATTMNGPVTVSCNRHVNSLECHKLAHIPHFSQCKPSHIGGHRASHKGQSQKHKRKHTPRHGNRKARARCRWGEFSFFDSLINHHKKPNADYEESSYGRCPGQLIATSLPVAKKVRLFASRSIYAGDEITVDYEDFEEEAL